MLKGLRHKKGQQMGTYKGGRMRGLFRIRDLYSTKHYFLTAKFGNKEAKISK